MTGHRNITMVMTISNPAILSAPPPMQSDTEMRRLGSCLDWEDAALVGRLYALFLGTLAPKNATSRQLPKPGEVSVGFL